MKKGVTLRAALNLGTDDPRDIAQAQRKLEAAFKRANPDLQLRILDQQANLGVLAFKLYIKGEQAAPLDFVATAKEALRLAVEKVQPSAAGFAAASAASLAAGPAIDVIENEDENEGLYAPEPASQLPKIEVETALATTKKKTAPQRKKKLGGGAFVVPPPGTFNGCPLGGSGGDSPLNEIKNRTDVAPRWHNTSVQSIIDLDWPQTINEKDRLRWSSADMDEIKRNEGTPVRIKGWLAAAKKEHEESCNCNSRTDVDYHLWLVGDKSKAAPDHRGESVVCEISPRVRAQHTGWDIKHIGRIASSLTKVRLSGWLLMDQHHAEQIGIFRATLWEIHPIMEFEVQREGKWVALDDDEG